MTTKINYQIIPAHVLPGIAKPAKQCFCIKYTHEDGTHGFLQGEYFSEEDAQLEIARHLSAEN